MQRTQRQSNIKIMDSSPVLPASTPRWEFDRKSPNAPQIEPIQGELFSGEALEAAASALVRETIQNSLDARAGQDPVRVRFTIPDEPVLRGFGSPWLAGLQPHLTAERNGRDKTESSADLFHVAHRRLRYLRPSR
jgi:hypothetical protein